MKIFAICVFVTLIASFLKVLFMKDGPHKCHFIFRCHVVNYGHCSCGRRIHFNELEAAHAKGETSRVIGDCRACGHCR